MKLTIVPIILGIVFSYNVFAKTLVLQSGRLVANEDNGVQVHTEKVGNTLIVNIDLNLFKSCDIRSLSAALFTGKPWPAFQAEIEEKNGIYKFMVEPELAEKTQVGIYCVSGSETEEYSSYRILWHEEQ